MKSKQRTGRIQIHRKPLTRTLQKLRDGKLTVGYIGGSVTDGRSGESWPEPVTAWLVDNFPSARIVVENTAIGGTGSGLGVFRADEYLIDRGVDLVFIEYCVNDWLLPPERNRRTEEGLIRKLMAAGIDVVLVYIFWYPMYEDMMTGKIPKTIVAFEELAEHYDLGSVWVGMQAFQEVRQGLMRWEEWLPDGVHPASRGSLSFGQAVNKFLAKELLSPAGRRAKVPAGKRPALPAPMDPKNWQGAYCIDFDKVRTEGPWSVRRSLKWSWYDYILQTASPGAKLSFDFEGRALVLGFDFDKTGADLAYRIDNGPLVILEHKERYEWASTYGWYCLDYIAEDLKPGKHHFEMEARFGGRADCAGSNCRLVLIGAVK